MSLRDETGGRAGAGYLAAVMTWGCRRWSRTKGSGSPSPGKAAATTRGSQDWCMLSIMRSASSITCGQQEAWHLVPSAAKAPGPASLPAVGNLPGSGGARG